MRKQIERNLSNLCTNGADGISPIVYVQTLMYTVGSLSKDTPELVDASYFSPPQLLVKQGPLTKRTLYSLGIYTAYENISHGFVKHTIHL